LLITNNARPRSRSAVGLVVAVAVVVVIAVASFAVVTLTGHKKTPVANPTGATTTEQQQPSQPTATTDRNITATTAAPDPAIAHNQAAAIDSVLTASVNSRRKLNNAIDEVNRCTNLDGAVSDMNAAGQERQSEITSVRNTDLSAIPTGGQVRDLLLQALQYSQQADASYAAWAQGAVDNGCVDSGQRDRDYAEGQRLSGLAKQAKTAFLATWNPVASANGVSARSPDDI
jgi:flagellar basal body-associated protein FliL